MRNSEVVEPQDKYKIPARAIIERKRFFEISRASAYESASVFDILYSLNLISKNDHEKYKDILLQIVKMIYRLR